jgi:hypothetical protein
VEYNGLELTILKLKEVLANLKVDGSVSLRISYLGLKYHCISGIVNIEDRLPKDILASIDQLNCFPLNSLFVKSVSDLTTVEKLDINC